MARRKRKRPVVLPERRDRQPLILWGAAVVGAVLFIYLATTAEYFLQDDAYICFRYVKNYLAGDGLVFNVGERVEGYTNFLWVILLALVGKFGWGLESAARWLGILCGAGTVVAVVHLARRVLADCPPSFIYLGSLLAGLWVAVNPALAYWAVAGLETGLFVLLITWAVERLLADSPLCWGLLVLATLTRPEGGLVFVVAVLWFFLSDPTRLSKGWRAPIFCYLIPLIPFGLFKLFYYGSLFPNPFFAKTGFSLEYWQSGLDYLWLYLQHFGLWGGLPILMIVGLIRRGGRSPGILPAIIWLGYTVYIISIGGDVLRAHRFFVPVWPVFTVGVIAGMIYLIRPLQKRVVMIGGTAVLLIGLAGYQWYYHAEYFSTSRALENSLVDKMRTIAGLLEKTDAQQFSLAASTIGRLGYDLADHPLFDMLGLTDSTVARHPETIPGMQTTWKERNFNAGYILSRDPDYILFSTGYKPSAPAERALILHAKFRQNYTVYLYPAPEMNRNLAVYKRIGEYTKPDSVWPDLQLADDFNDALNQMLAGETQKSITTLTRMKHNGPGDFDLPDNLMAVASLRLGLPKQALAYADSALALNPSSISALTAKFDACQRLGDQLTMRRVERRIIELCPWLAER